MHILALFCVLVVAGAPSGCECRRHESCHHENGTPAPLNLSEAPVTVTPSGSIRGSWLYTRRGCPIEAYRGIRFAEPPVGDLRFKPPQPILQYEGEVDATVDGPACPQPIIANFPVDEDCLRLNVYTPGKACGPLPVVVYYHAGGLYSISGRSDIEGPSYLLDRPMILVTVNYRLASLGFLSTGDEYAPGNNGFKDQVVALRWVQRNIAAFGGDPGCVTIAGCSAGSLSVSLHMVSPMSAGLFHRAISMSGSAISQIELPHDQNNLAIKQAELLNCPTDNSQAILNCLQTKTSTELGNSLGQFFEFADDPILVWVPIIEEDFGQERFLTEHPLESIRQGRMHAVPYIVSQTEEEFYRKALNILNSETLTTEMDTEWYRIAPIAFLLPPPSNDAADTLRNFYLGGHNNGRLVNDSETAINLGKLYSDGDIGFGVHTLANVMAVYSPAPLYYYQFAYVGNLTRFIDPYTNEPTGAGHGEDQIFLFNVDSLLPRIEVSSSQDSRQVDRMTAIWYNFMRYGNPNPTPDTPELTYLWPRMTHTRRRYLRIGTEFSVRENLYEDRFQVWERLYNPENCAYCTY